MHRNGCHLALRANGRPVCQEPHRVIGHLVPDVGELRRDRPKGHAHHMGDDSRAIPERRITIMATRPFRGDDSYVVVFGLETSSARLVGYRS